MNREGETSQGMSEETRQRGICKLVTEIEGYETSDKGMFQIRFNLEAPFVL